MQKVNREKSLLKIKELTEQHKLKKNQEESKSGSAVTNGTMEVESDEEDGAAAKDKHVNKNT